MGKFKNEVGIQTKKGTEIRDVMVLQYTQPSFNWTLDYPELKMTIPLEHFDYMFAFY